MSALVHRIETPSTRDVWAAEGDGRTAHLVLAAQLLTEQSALCGYEPRADWMATDGPHPVKASGRCEACRQEGPMNYPFKPEGCPRCGVMCKVYDWSSVDIGVGMQHYDPEYECPEHGVWALVRDEPPDDSPWALGAQRVVWRDDDCA